MLRGREAAPRTESSKSARAQAVGMTVEGGLIKFVGRYTLPKKLGTYPGVLYRLLSFFHFGNSATNEAWHPNPHNAYSSPF